MHFIQQRGYDVVAEEVARILELRSTEPAIITGLRTVEEIELLRRRVPSIEVVAIHADTRTRYFRTNKRGRDQQGKTLKDFEKLDEEQALFGLLPVIEDVADHTIVNNGESLSRYLDEVRTIFLKDPERQASLPVIEPFSTQSELVRTLAALERIGGAATCPEIHVVTVKLRGTVRKYNTNRALKGVPELAARSQDGLVRYELTGHGHIFLKLMRLARKIQ